MKSGVTDHRVSKQIQSVHHSRQRPVSQTGLPCNRRQQAAHRRLWSARSRVPAPMVSRLSEVPHCCQLQEESASEPKPRSGFRQIAPSIRSGSSRHRTRHRTKPGTRHSGRSTGVQSGTLHPGHPGRERLSRRQSTQMIEADSAVPIASFHSGRHSENSTLFEKKVTVGTAGNDQPQSGVARSASGP